MMELLIKLYKLKVKLYLLVCSIFKLFFSSISVISKDNPPFSKVYYQHHLNVSDKWVNYLEVYEYFFKAYVAGTPSVLEIGIQNGGNLQILKQYFRNAKIYGVDINPKVGQLDLGDDIKIFNFDATDEKAIKKNLNHLKFDIIIDDGSYICSDVINSFYLFFPLLKPDGIYLVEDLHTSYWNSHGGAYLSKNSSIEFFKKFTDLLNFYHIEDDLARNSFSEQDIHIAQWLQAITFYDSVAIIKKLKKQRKGPYKRSVVGSFDPIVPRISEAIKQGWYYHA